MRKSLVHKATTSLNVDSWCRASCAQVALSRTELFVRQALLLDVLQRKRFQRWGSPVAGPIDVRAYTRTWTRIWAHD